MKTCPSPSLCKALDAVGKQKAYQPRPESKLPSMLCCDWFLIFLGVIKGFKNWMAKVSSANKLSCSEQATTACYRERDWLPPVKRGDAGDCC